MFYIMVAGPNDQCFVGPFPTRELAEDFAVSDTLDVWVMTEQEKNENLTAYGEMPTFSPAEWHD